jgi:hypothetical protein
MRLLSACEPVHPSPCSGLCSNPVSFSVPDGHTFESGPLGTRASCHETSSKLLAGTSSNFGDRTLTVNGREMPSSGNWPYPLPPQRNEGYCIRTTASQFSSARFTVR